MQLTGVRFETDAVASQEELEVLLPELHQTRLLKTLLLENGLKFLR
jgi:hypothetical protein